MFSLEFLNARFTWGFPGFRLAPFKIQSHLERREGVETVKGRQTKPLACVMCDYY